MMRKIVAPGIPEPPPGTFTNCFVVGDTVYVSGQHAGDAAPGMSVGDQSRLALARIKALVEAAGASVADIVKLTVYLTDIDKRAEVSAARREFFSGDFPCSTLVEISALAAPGAAVEIEAIAVIGAGKSA